MQLMHSLKYRVCMENEYMHAYFTLFPTLLTFVGTTGGGLHPRGWPAVRVVFTKRACIYANELPRRSVQRIRKGKEALAARRPKGRLGPSLRSAASSATLLQSWHHVFKQTASHLPHEGNVEQIFSLGGRLSDPNMDPSYLATLVFVGSNEKVYMPPKIDCLSAIPSQVLQAG